MGKIGYVFIFPYTGCPFKKIYENGKHTSCQYQEFSCCALVNEEVAQQSHSGTVHKGGKNKSAAVAKGGADGTHAILPVGLMLVDLGEGVKAANQQAGCQ